MTTTEPGGRLPAYARDWADADRIRAEHIDPHVAAAPLLSDLPPDVQLRLGQLCGPTPNEAVEAA